MSHESSGKHGDRFYYSLPTDFRFDRAVLMILLKREEALRFSPETQRKYTECGDDCDKIAEVTLDLQKRVLTEWGVPAEHLSEAMKALHNVRVDYQNDDEVLNISVYHRADHCFGTPSTVENCLLYSLRGEQVFLFDLLAKKDHELEEKPLVLVAGSLT